MKVILIIRWLKNNIPQTSCELDIVRVMAMGRGIMGMGRGRGGQLPKRQIRTAL